MSWKRMSSGNFSPRALASSTTSLSSTAAPASCSGVATTWPASLMSKYVARQCDRLLRTDDFGDWEGAVNGLQVENRGTITRVAAAVDASLATVKLAVAAKADLMIVHHGLFWSPSHPWTGKRHELLRLLL